MDVLKVAILNYMGASFKQGLVPCTNADDYLFWDSMHPTQVVHQVLYYLVLDQIATEILNEPVDLKDAATIVAKYKES